MAKKDSKKRLRKEENKKEVKELIDKFEDDVDFDLDSNTDSSTSESEDEDAEALTTKVDRDWYRTLAALKTNDPKIHDKNAKFYDTSSDSASDEEPTPKKSKKNKPFLLRDYQKDVLIKKKGIIDEEDEMASTSFVNSEEQNEVRNSLKAALIDSEEESGDDDFLKKREKTEVEEEEEEEEYVNWLKGDKMSLQEDKQVKKDLKPLKKLWNKPDLDKNEKFLADFFLNKRYISKKAETRLPTYEEIINEEKQDISKFMGKTKHRYEEPGGKSIPTFPRKVEDSVRRKDTRRADKNRDVRERKLKQKEEKRKEINKLKATKRKEILAKIKKIKQITGNENIGFTEQDLEEDFDPEKHDKMMEEKFNTDYYDEREEEMEKPTFEDDEDEDIAGMEEDWNGAGPSQEEYNGAGTSEDVNFDDSNFNMDADYDPSQDLRVGKKKKKSKFTEAVKRKKPLFDPDEKSFPEYFDEYYKLDFEDVIGDMPCRYKYRKTEANDFGLTIEEVLAAPDKDLNKWATTQKVVSYLTEEEERIEKIKYKKRGKSMVKKLNLMPGLREGIDPKVVAEVDEKSKQKIQEKIKKKQTRFTSSSKNKNKKFRNKGRADRNNEGGERQMSEVQKSANASDSRVKAYGYDPRKLNYLHTDNYNKR
ncbi:protein KRI1 homolog [Patella vulgata]|uniref:protein KRI1 homolog n=1 Tax=Patella vulgata TaxID=6465 RepID=UPI00217F7D9D|nr:protein KRI1 homolog [Patella vulgata]